MSESPKHPKEFLALQLVPVVPDGTPREAAPRIAEPAVLPPAHAALWFDDPDTRYVLH